MSISLETYFWIIDRLEIEDDSRNKVNKSKNQVTLSKSFLKKCENGQYIGRLLAQMYNTFRNRQDKTFDIPPAVTELTDETPPYNPNVWKNIFDTLSQYGCRIDPSKQDIMIKTSRQDSVLEILDCLFEIDNSSTGQISATTKRKLGIKIAQPSISPISNDQNSEMANDHHKSERRGSIATSRAKKLQPLNDLLSPKQQRSRSPDRPDQLLQLRKTPSISTLISPKGKSPNRILGKEYSLTIDIGPELEEVMPNSFEACRTSFQFILLSLSIAFGMKPKQAASLLTNNNKVIAHICVKGEKGEDFQNARKWFDILNPVTDQLVNLINTEKKDVLSYKTPLVPIHSKITDAKLNRRKILIKTLNIFKWGLYSRNHNVQISCGNLFYSILSEINESAQEMRNDVWEWLNTQTQEREWKRASIDGSIRDSSKLTMGNHLVKAKSQLKQYDQDVDNKKSKGGKQIEIYENQTGLQAILFAYQTNNELLDCIVNICLKCGQIKPQEFFNFQLLQQSYKWSLYGTISLDIFIRTLGDQDALIIIENSGVLNNWIVQSLNIAESSSEVLLTDRIVSLVLMTEIWLERPQYFDGAINRTPDAIMKILKRGARDVKRTLCIVSIELMFRLLQNFA